MKYKIIVEKTSEIFYLAYCPVMPRMQCFGVTADEALAKLQGEFLCYLHDPKAELEIIFDERYPNEVRSGIGRSLL